MHDVADHKCNFTLARLLSHSVTKISNRDEIFRSFHVLCLGVRVHQYRFLDYEFLVFRIEPPSLARRHRRCTSEPLGEHSYRLIHPILLIGQRIPLAVSTGDKKDKQLNPFGVPRE